MIDKKTITKVKEVICTCDKFKKYMPEITAAQNLAWSHKQIYSGEMFKFCPWCGEELIHVRTLKTEVKKKILKHLKRKLNEQKI